MWLVGETSYKSDREVLNERLNGRCLVDNEKVGDGVREWKERK